MLSITIGFFSLQMFDVDGHWNHLPARITPDLKNILLTLLRSKASIHRRDTRKRFLGFLNGVICPMLGRCLLTLSLSQFRISIKRTKFQTPMPHYFCLTQPLMGFILSFLTTIHFMVQFVIICWKGLNIAS